MTPLQQLQSKIQKAKHCECCIKRRKRYTRNAITYRRTKLGVYTAIFGQQRKKSKQRGHKPPEYTKVELVDWMKIHGFDGLYDTWVKSGYQTGLKPSIDRLDDSIGYKFGNISLVTWGENDKNNHHNLGKEVQQIKDGVVIATFNSTYEAERATGILHTGIGQVALGRQEHAGNYQWEYIK